MLSRSGFLRPLLLIALMFVIAGGVTMAFGATDVTAPRAIPYTTSNFATGLSAPVSIAIDDNGNIYVGENTLTTNGSAVVKKIDATTGAVTVFAGGTAKAAAGSSPCTASGLLNTSLPGGGDVVGDGCPATFAFFGGSNGGVRGLAVYNNYLFIEDMGGYLIHRVNLANNYMELIGGGPTSTVWPGDGGPVVVGSDITKNFNLFKPPTGFAVDPGNGNVYFGAGGTSASTIRMITSDTATCNSAVGGPYTAPCVITVVNYLVKQTGATVPPNTCADPTATLTAKNATLYYPQGLAFDSDRNLYIAENQCFAVRKLTKNPNTGIVDQNSTFTTLAGNNVKTGSSPAWYDTTVAPAFFAAARGIAPAGGNDLFISSATAIYFYDSTTGWAHRIFGEAAGAKDANLNFICSTNTASPYIGCPAPWATYVAGASYGNHMAVDKAGNLYTVDYQAGTVVKISIGTDFAGIAPTVKRTGPATQYVLLHGGAVTGATADSPFSAALTIDTVPKPGCTAYGSSGDKGSDCVMAVTYTPSVVGPETGKLHVQAGPNGKDISLQAIGNPSIAPKVTLAADHSVCSTASTCDIVLTATVTAGSNPISTGLAVSANMSACTGGSATQAFQAGAANTFTYTCSLPTTVAQDVTLGPATVSDDQTRTSPSNTLLVSVIAPAVAQSQSVTVTFNTPRAITLVATGSGVLTYAVATPPAHGTLTGDAPALTYTPESNYFGTDSFTFTAANAGGTSEPATVNITVDGAPKPVAAPQSLTIAVNATANITLTASNGPIGYTYTQPANGVVSGTAPNVTYTPNADFQGSDSFTFTATNDGGTSAPATISITVTTPVASTLAAPTAGTTLSGRSASFAWTTGTLVDHYMLCVGTSPGATDIHYSGGVTSTTANVTGLRTVDGNIYVRVYSWIPTLNGWQHNDYVFAYDFPKAATLIAPVSSLSGSSATFTWTPGNMATKYMLMVGTSVGATDDFYSGETTSTTLDVTGLRSTDGNIYVRLYSYYENGWHYNDYTFAYTTPAAARLTSPLVSINGNSATFTWTAGTLVTKYMLYVGTAPAIADDYYSGEVTTTSLTVNGLRSSDGNIYVRLYSWFENGWHYNDYVLTHTPPVTPVAATLTAPVAISGTSAEFTWTAGTAIEHYMLCVGTHPGGTDNYYSGPTTSTDIVVDGMRTTDGNIYVRLYSWATDHWLWKDYVFAVQQ